MDFDARPHAALHAAIAKLLRPLFRLLLRHQVSFGAFEQLAKHVYVDVALTEFGIPGKKPSISRASILSGLTRKEVQRLVNASRDRDYIAIAGTIDSQRYNRAARVLTGWVRDADFLDAKERPRPLPADGDISFATLVRRHSGDMPARAVLDELERVGAVQYRADGLIELRARAYVPKHSAADKLAILGSDVADLIATIDHNLEHGDTDPRFQRKVMYDSIPDAALPAFRKRSATNAQALLEKFDRWLAEHDIENPPERPDAARSRVGIGIYYFEEPAASTAPPSPESGGKAP
ncbi:MAG TPA: DUF6502 family protein [Burkholderiaceae bacterium]